MRTAPVAVPMVDVPSGDAADRLWARRRILVSGSLDGELVNRVAAELMALDGRSAADVELLINSDGGPPADVVVLLDVIGAMRAPVVTTCMGRAKGTAAVLLASGTGRRTATPSSVLSLRIAWDERIEGRPDEVRTRLDELDLARRNVLRALVASTGRREEDLAEGLDRGPIVDADQAVALGLIDVVER
jgi:ATP-dependent Clp protease protease subunit